MSFPFTPTSPAASEALAQSQPLIQQNFNSTNSILGVDHVSFGNSTGGQHKQTTFPGFSSPAMPAGECFRGLSSSRDCGCRHSRILLSKFPGYISPQLRRRLLRLHWHRRDHNAYHIHPKWFQHSHSRVRRVQLYNHLKKRMHHWK